MTTAQQNTNQPVQTIDQPLLEQIIAATQQAAAVLVSRQVVDWDKELRGAQYLLKSGLCPKQLKTAEAVLFVILAGRDLNLSAVASLRGLTVIQGKLEVSADLQLGLFHKAGGQSEWLQLTEKVASIQLSAPWSRRPHTSTFTMVDAHRAGLDEDTTKFNDDGTSYIVKSNYNLYPRAMLRSRAITQGLKDIGFDGTAGLYAPGEIGGEVEVITSTKDGQSETAQVPQEQVQEPPQDNGQHDEQHEPPRQPAKPAWAFDYSMKALAEAGVNVEEFKAAMRGKGYKLYDAVRDTPIVMQMIAEKKAPSKPKPITKEQGTEIDDLGTQLTGAARGENGPWTVEDADRLTAELFGHSVDVDRMTEPQAKQFIEALRAKLGEGVPT